MTSSVAGAALVAPPGTFAPTGTLPDGEIIITIERIDPENGFADDGTPIPSEHHMVRCIYPDGFIKNHQVNDLADLLGKVAGQMKGRFGMSQVAYKSTPQALEAGETITVER